MQRDVKIGLGVVVVGLAVFAALRFGGGPAAKSGLDLALANLPPGWSATHGAVTYDALSGNAQVRDLVVTHDDQIVFSAAAVLASGISGITPTSPPKRIGHITIKDAAGTAMLRHVGRLELDGVEVENFRKIFDPASYPDGKPVSDAKLKLIEQIDSTDVALHVDFPKQDTKPGVPPLRSADIRVAEWHMADLNGRQLPMPPQPPQSDQYWNFVAALLKDVGYGSQVAKGITQTMPGAGELRIGSEEVTGVQDGRIHSAQVQDTSFDNTAAAAAAPDKLGPFHFTLDRVTLSGLDLGKVIDALPDIMARSSEKHPNLTGGLHMEVFEAGGLRFETRHFPVVTIASFSGITQYQADGAQTGTGSIHGLKIAYSGREISPQVGLALQRFGMSDFNMDFDEASSLSPKDDRLKITQADWTFHGLGALRMTADIAGFNTAAGAGPADQLTVLRSLRLYGASIRWDDASLTDRLFHLISLEQGKSVEALRAQLSIPLMSLGFLMPEQPDAGAQVNAFLDGKHRLIVTLAPPHAPVSLGDVAAASPAEKAAILGITIKGD